MTMNNIKYLPILALKPAEMAAIEELPEKDKDLILPLFPLKKWVASKSLKNSTERIRKAIGDRPWIADLDKDILSILSAPQRNNTDEAITTLENLLNSNNGYENWINYVKEKENIIPTLQLNDTAEIETQIINLAALNRPIAVRFEMSGLHAINSTDFNFVIRALLAKIGIIPKIFLILDYGDFDRSNLLEHSKYSKLVTGLYNLFPEAIFSISGTSFPYSFSGSYKGEIPIYERQIFNKVCDDCKNVTMIYSDRGSARALANTGGSGTPPPRIDYPLKNDWRFIRKDLSPSSKKEQLYQDIANEIINSNYWDPNLKLWGTQMMEKTKTGDPYAITSAAKATAVRINMHLYQQLHYSLDTSELDSDEDWID